MKNTSVQAGPYLRWGSLAIFAMALLGVLVHAVSIVRDEIAVIEPAHSGLTLPDSNWQELRFSTRDNLHLAAWYSPTQNGQTIVVLHGFGSNRSQVLPVAKMLRDQGFGVLSYDTRAHGQSDGNEIGYGEKEVLDLKAALDWLEHREEVDVTRIGVYGFSLGAVIAAREAVDDQRISSLVLAGTPSSIFALAADGSGGGIKGNLDAALRMTTARLAGIKRYEHSTIEAVKALGGRPLLLIAGGDDEVVPSKRAWEIFAAAGYPKAIALFPEARHGDYDQIDPLRFQKTILKHFKRTLDKRRVISGR